MIKFILLGILFFSHVAGAATLTKLTGDLANLKHQASFGSPSSGYSYCGVKSDFNFYCQNEFASESKVVFSGEIVDADFASASLVAFTRMQNIAAGSIILGNGSNVPTPTVMSGDATINSSGVLDIAANAVENTEIRQSAALSVIGRSANSLGDVADIAASVDGQILLRDGTSLAFGQASSSGIQAGAVTNAKLADMATSTVKGRAAGLGTGAPSDLTTTQLTALIDNFVGDSGAGGTKGAVPAPAAGDASGGKFLKADGTWAAPSGTGGGAVFLGSLYRDGASSCSGTVSTQDTFVSYAADTDCPNYTATNSTYVAAPATKVPGFLLKDAAIDTSKYYMIVVSGLFTLGGSGQCVYRMTDGTTNTLSANQNGASSGGPVTTGTWTVWYKPASTGDKTIQIQAAPEDAATQCILSGGSNTLKTLSFDVYRFDSI